MGCDTQSQSPCLNFIITCRQCQARAKERVTDELQYIPSSQSPRKSMPKSAAKSPMSLFTIHSTSAPVIAAPADNQAWVEYTFRSSKRDSIDHATKPCNARLPAADVSCSVICAINAGDTNQGTGLRDEPVHSQLDAALSDSALWAELRDHQNSETIKTHDKRLYMHSSDGASHTARPTLCLLWKQASALPPQLRRGSPQSVFLRHKAPRSCCREVQCELFCLPCLPATCAKCKACLQSKG